MIFLNMHHLFKGPAMLLLKSYNALLKAKGLEKMLL